MRWFPQYVQVALQEVPSEISLVIPLAGCGMHCKNCHSSMYQDLNKGDPFDFVEYEVLLKKYQNKCSCVCLFEGGDPTMISLMADVAHELGFKCAIYSGHSYDPARDWVGRFFDYVKVGCYVEELGGLDDPQTNQRMYKKVGREWRDITASFWREEG